MSENIIKKKRYKRPPAEGKKEGRPRVEIDFKQLDSLCMIQCTGEEIASVLGVSYDTIERRVKEKFKISLADYLKEKAQGGKASLRRSQWRAAIEDKNVTMLIWLGKNMLAQTDKSEVKQDTTLNIEIVDFKREDCD